MGIAWNEPVTAVDEYTSTPSNEKNIYNIYFTNGQMTAIEADGDYIYDEFEDNYPILRLYDGSKKEPKIVAIFNLDQIAGYSIANGYSTDDDWEVEDEVED